MQLTALLTSLFVSFAVAAAPTTRHFYSTNSGGEYVAGCGYGSKYIFGYSLANSVPGSVPIYRCRTGSNPDFFSFLTTDANCEGAAGYIREGAVTNIFASRQPGTYQLWRLVNSRGDHMMALYNPDTGEGPYGVLSCDLNQYAREGIVGYMYPTFSNEANTIALWSFRKGCNSDRDQCCN